MSDVALSTRDRQRADTHRRIFETAAAQLRVHGLAGTSVAEVAKAAGVSRQTFYDHFPCIEDVVAEAFTRYRDRVAARLGPSLGNGRPQPLVVLLDGLVDALFGELEADGSQLRLEIAAYLARGVEVRGWLDEPLFRVVADSVAEAQRRGEIITETTADDFTRALLTALGGFLLIESEAPAERAERARQTIQLILRGAAP